MLDGAKVSIQSTFTGSHTQTHYLKDHQVSSLKIDLVVNLKQCTHTRVVYQRSTIDYETQPELNSWNIARKPQWNCVTSSMMHKHYLQLPMVLKSYFICTVVIRASWGGIWLSHHWTTLSPSYYPLMYLLSRVVIQHLVLSCWVQYSQNSWYRAYV